MSNVTEVKRSVQIISDLLTNSRFSSDPKLLLSTIMNSQLALNKCLISLEKELQK
jgi:signal transduction histidine kinase